jgi:hypothetical protein
MMMMYLLVSQHVSAIIMPIIRRMVQNRQRLRCRSQQVHTEPPLLHESTAGRPVLYTIGVVGLYHSPDDGHDDARNMLRHQ